MKEVRKEIDVENIAGDSRPETKCSKTALVSFCAGCLAWILSAILIFLVSYGYKIMETSHNSTNMLVMDIIAVVGFLVPVLSIVAVFFGFDTLAHPEINGGRGSNKKMAQWGLSLGILLLIIIVFLFYIAQQRC